MSEEIAALRARVEVLCGALQEVCRALPGDTAADARREFACTSVAVVGNWSRRNCRCPPPAPNVGWSVEVCSPGAVR
jgi:hypothetical protein